MHSRLLMLFWRKKLLLLATSLLFLVALWFWGFLYTTHITDGGKIVSVRELMMGGSGSASHHESLLQKLGLYDEASTDDSQLPNGAGGVKFVKPTGSMRNKG